MSKKIILLFVILISIPSVIAFDQITGYFGSSYQVEGLLIDQEITAPVELEYELFQGAGFVSSLSIDGMVEGNGTVKVIAEDESGNEFVIADYKYKERSGFSRFLTSFISNIGNSLTGAVVDSGNYGSAEYIDSECVDTCNLRGEFKGNKLKISVEVEPGTSFNLYKINYGAYTGTIQEKTGSSFFSSLWDKIFG